MSLEEIIEAAVARGVARGLAELKPPAAPDELLAAPDAAKLAAVSPATIRRWVSQGLLKRYGSGRAFRVRREDVLSVRPPEAESDAAPDVDEVAARLMGKKG